MWWLTAPVIITSYLTASSGAVAPAVVHIRSVEPPGILLRWRGGIHIPLRPVETPVIGLVIISGKIIPVKPPVVIPVVLLRLACGIIIPAEATIVTPSIVIISPVEVPVIVDPVPGIRPAEAAVIISSIIIIPAEITIIHPVPECAVCSVPVVALKLAGGKIPAALITPYQRTVNIHFIIPVNGPAGAVAVVDPYRVDPSAVSLGIISSGSVTETIA